MHTVTRKQYVFTLTVGLVGSNAHGGQQLPYLHDGQVPSQVKVHLTPCNGTHHKLRSVDPKLCPENIHYKDNVLLAGDDDVVHIATSVHLPNLLHRSPTVLHPSTRECDHISQHLQAWEHVGSDIEHLAYEELVPVVPSKGLDQVEIEGPFYLRIS